MPRQRVLDLAWHFRHFDADAMVENTPMEKLEEWIAWQEIRTESEETEQVPASEWVGSLTRGINR